MGGGRHVQDIRVETLFDQQSPLAYAEAVLFVHDHEAQVVEAGLGLNQCLCSDDDIHLARPRCRLRSAAIPCRAAGEDLYRQPDGLE